MLPQFLMDSAQPIHVSRAALGSLIKYGGEFDKQTLNLHPGRLTWNLQITHLERKMKIPNLHEDMFQPLIFRGVIIDACEPRFDTWPTPRGQVKHQEQLGSRTAMIYVGGSSQAFLSGYTPVNLLSNGKSTI